MSSAKGNFDLRTVAIVGNGLYFLWIVYNGIDEGFHDIGTVQGVAMLGVLILFVLNIVVLSHRD